MTTTITKSLNPIKRPSLFELTSELQDALSKIEPNPETGELEGMEAFEQLALNTQEKILDCGMAIRNMESLVEQIAEQQKELLARRRCVERIIDRIKSRCVQSLEWMEMESITAPNIKVLLKPSSSVEVYDEESIPPEYRKTKTTITVDKAAITRAAKAGEEVPGARLVQYNVLLTK